MMKSLHSLAAKAVAMAALVLAGVRNGDIDGQAGVSGGHRGVARGKTGALRIQRAAQKARNVKRNRKAHR